MLFETIAVAFAMFSALPVPQPEWNRRNMRYALCAFPLIGVVIGGLWWGWSALCGALHLPDLLRAADRADKRDAEKKAAKSAAGRDGPPET